MPTEKSFSEGTESTLTKGELQCVLRSGNLVSKVIEVDVFKAEADGGGVSVFVPARADGGSSLHGMEDHLVILAREVSE